MGKQTENSGAVTEVSDIQQALEITALRNGNGRSYQLFQIVGDNSPIARCLIKAEARKWGYGVEDFRDLTQIPKEHCRKIVLGALGPFTNLFNYCD